MAADVKSLNIDELTGLVNLYPWFGLARKELCARMAAISGSNWGEEQFADISIKQAKTGNKKARQTLSRGKRYSIYSETPIRQTIQTRMP